MNNTRKAITKDQLDTAVARVASEVSNAAAQDIENSKPTFSDFTIPTTGWVQDASVPDYPLRYDLTVTGVTANDRATVIIAAIGQADAIACGLCPTNETLANTIRLRSRTAPEAAIPAVYWLDEGRSN